MPINWWRWSVGSVLLMVAGWAVIERPWQSREESPAVAEDAPAFVPTVASERPVSAAVVPEVKPQLPAAITTGPQRQASFTLGDDEVRKLVLATWEQDYYGRRVLTVREDGTATMKYYPAGVVRQSVYGKELTVEFAWSLRDGVITLTNTGGSPAGKIQLATALYGKERVQPIVELTDATFQLLGVNGKENDPAWKRVAESAAP